MTKQSQQLVLMLIIGALIGYASFKVFNGPTNTSTEANGTTPTGVATTTDVLDATKEKSTLSSGHQFPLPPSVPANKRAGLAVADQVASHTVAVSGLSVENTSWVAIYDKRDGVPGSILGAQKVNLGESDVIVELLRPEGTVAGAEYYAAILPDNGDGQFDRLTDLPPFSPEKTVIVSWKAL